MPNKGFITRRHFFSSLTKAWAFLTGSLEALPWLSTTLRAKSGAGKSKVAVIKARQVLGKGSAARVKTIKQMADTGVSSVIGITASKDAWRSLFKPGERVGLKVNCLAGRARSTDPDLVLAVIECLKGCGIPEDKILVWDKTNHDLESAGFRVNRSGRGWQCYGTDQAGIGYERDILEFGSVGSCFTRILAQLDALINMPILKDHGLAGISGGLKNYYGAIHNPNKYHDNVCDPYVADIYLHPVLKNKTRLVVCDALKVQYHGGPGFKPGYIEKYRSVLVARDPVALDTVGYNVIESMRKKAGLKSLKDENRYPKYLETAADKDHRLGTCDPAAIEVKKEVV